MSTTRQYFDTDFAYALRVNVTFPAATVSCVSAIYYDPNARAAFLAFYLEDPSMLPADFEAFLGTLKYGSSQVSLNGSIVLPSARFFHGALRVENVHPFRVEYQFFGDPSWHDLLTTPPTQRVFIYAETSLKQAEVLDLQKKAQAMGHDLQIRDMSYSAERTRLEKPQAFISHDSRDKDVARRIALNLQQKACPVWYDEFSLALGDNLREKIELGLKECRKCVLVLSPNFIGNRGWGKKEFESVFTRELIEDARLVLPVWQGVSKKQVFDYSPSLLNVKGVDWDQLGEEEVCRQIYLAVSGET